MESLADQVLRKNGEACGIYHCLRVGVERKAGQVWLYASITVFPEAVLRYAPTGAGVKVGTH